MRFIIGFPKTLMYLPGRIRITIALLFFGLGGIPIFFNLIPTYEVPFLIILTIILSWLFRPSQAFLSLIVMTTIITITIAIQHHGLSPSESLAVVAESVVLTILYLIIAHLRSSVRKLHLLQIKVQKAKNDHTAEYEKHLKAVQTTREVILTYEQMKKINQLKDDFIVNVTHELRTPLTQVYGYLELLNDHRQTLDEKTTALFLRSATDGCQELVSLIDNVLDALSITDKMPTIKPEYLTLERIVQDVMEDILRETKPSFALQIDIPSSLMVWSDQIHLRRILQNLLTNACKYAPLSTTVHISATPWTHDQRWSEQHFLCISVQDEGPGIPQEEIPCLFEKFHRLKRDHSGSIRGTGLGLYLCKQYVQALGGQIWVESTGITGEGSCFRFTVRTKPQEQNGVRSA